MTSWQTTELLRRHIFEQGSGKMLVVDPIAVVADARDTSAGLPGVTIEELWSVDATTTLRNPFGSVREQPAALLPLLREWFAAYRHEPASTYNQHRLYASVRSKYPVQLFVETSDTVWHLDADDAAAHLVAPGTGSTPSGRTLIHLVGCWTHLPEYYRSLRSALVGVELGITLRHLFTALAAGGYQNAQILHETTDAESLLQRIGIRESAQWARPVSVAVEAAVLGIRPTSRTTKIQPLDAWHVSDETLDRIRLLDRDGVEQTLTEKWATSRSVPQKAEDSADTWLDVFGERTSGRMPLGLTGMKATRRQLEHAVATTVFEWSTTEAPSPFQRYRSRLTVTAAVRGVDGYANGVHRLDEADRRLVTEDSRVMDRLESIYGYPSAPKNGCAVRKANVVLFLSADPGAVVDETGATGWRLLQALCGWLAHGTCIGAAKHRLYARPVRAFDETAAKQILSLPDRDVPLLAVIVGSQSYRGMLMDVRPR